MADPMRVHLWISYQGSNTGYVYPMGLLTGQRGIRLTTTSPNIEVTQRTHGPLVAASWNAQSGLLPATFVVVEVKLRDFPRGIDDG
jgi:hypothetical protein